MAESLVGSAFLLGLARTTGILVGFLTLPAILHLLPGEAFSTWALLLALLNGFRLLELGQPLTLTRYLVSANNPEEKGALLWSGLAVISVACLTAFPLVMALSEPLADWLKLGPGQIVSGGSMVTSVYVCAAILALLRPGTALLSAGKHFTVVAGVSAVETILANTGAVMAAYYTRAPDATVLGYWAGQLLGATATFFLAAHFNPWHIAPATLDVRMPRMLLQEGVRIQIGQWAQFINYQFDKFIIAGLVGLWAVNPYEVANRAALALRSILTSGLESFLPVAAANTHQEQSLQHTYLAMTRGALWGAILVMLVPMSIAFPFLYAWAGESGYYARWLFIALGTGGFLSVLSIPAAIIAQVLGRSGLLARSALVSLTSNIPISLALLLPWGSLGAAAGTALSMGLAAIVLIIALHRRIDLDPLRTFAQLWRDLWPAVALCLIWGTVAALFFALWYASLPQPERYGWESRIIPGIVSLLLCGCCVTSIAVLSLRRNALSIPQLFSLLRRPASPLE